MDAVQGDSRARAVEGSTPSPPQRGASAPHQRRQHVRVQPKAPRLSEVSEPKQRRRERKGPPLQTKRPSRSNRGLESSWTESTKWTQSREIAGPEQSRGAPLPPAARRLSPSPTEATCSSPTQSAAPKRGREPRHRRRERKRTPTANQTVPRSNRGLESSWTESTKWTQSREIAGPEQSRGAPLPPQRGASAPHQRRQHVRVQPTLGVAARSVGRGTAAVKEKNPVAKQTGFGGSSCWTRTNDPVVNSHLLYRLS